MAPHLSNIYESTMHKSNIRGVLLNHSLPQRKCYCTKNLRQKNSVVVSAEFQGERPLFEELRWTHAAQFQRQLTSLRNQKKFRCDPRPDLDSRLSYDSRLGGTEQHIYVKLANKFIPGFEFKTPGFPWVIEENLGFNTQKTWIIQNLVG